jgi:hypothetical protein
VIYLIDGNTVNSAGQWTHQLAPAPEQGRVEQFPGIGQQFYVDAARKPADLVVEGFLHATGASVAAASVALDNLVRTWDAVRGDGQIHTVTINTQTHSHCKLRAFNTLGKPQRRDQNGTLRVAYRVRFVWLRLTDTVT